MRVFEDINNVRRIVCYKGLNLDLIERHHAWCKKKFEEEQPIYLIFFLQDPEDIRLYKSNRLSNSLCIVYEIDSSKTVDWIKNFCQICYSDSSQEKRELYFNYGIPR